MSELRSILRRETARAHARLDAALVKYDLTSRAGLAAYLSVHYAARRQLGLAINHFACSDDNRRKLVELECDIKTLGAPLPIDSPQIPVEIHPLGLTYVMAGSSLGSKVLHREWLPSTDSVVRNAGRFLTSSKDSTVWMAFLQETDNLKLPRDEVDTIVASAIAVFAIFEAANDKIKQAYHE